MGAPRRKGGAAADPVEVQEALQTLQLIEEGELPSSEKLSLVPGGRVVPCQGTCKANDKSNPCCLCCLVPATGSFKKKGLWKKELDVLSQLGPDPRDSARQELSTPAGLSNLGNTCYFNSALQCLFMVPRFRDALYSVPPPVANQEIVAQLRKLFLALDFGPHRVADPTAFVNCLNLNHAVQQDGQEFFKLLLTKVESLLSTDKEQEFAGVVAQLFKGQLSYMTVCKACGQPSKSSLQGSDYYELPLQVKGFSSLQESMVSALAAETLDGDNQYKCDVCNSKQDATRQMVLRSLPPYMCLQLQRFVWDERKGDKAKAMDKFTFPLLLDTQQVLACVAPEHDQGVRTEFLGAEPGNKDAGQYELCAVLIHKGHSASHGHYVAHIKSPSGTWWRFDDEAVVDMGLTPTSHPADHGTSTHTGDKAAKSGKGGSSKAKGVAKGGSSKGKRARAGSSRKPAAGRKRAKKAADSSEEDTPEETQMSDVTSEEEVETDAGEEGDDEYSEPQALPSKPRRGTGKQAGKKPADDGDEEMEVIELTDTEGLQQPAAGRGAGGGTRGKGRGRGRGRAGRGRGKSNTQEDYIAAADGQPDAVMDQAADGGTDATAARGEAAAGCNGMGPAPPTSITSANAYMLLYRQVGWQEAAPVQQPDLLPEGPKAEVVAMQQEYQAKCEHYAVTKGQALERVNQRRETVRAVLQEAWVVGDDPGYMVPSAWLEAWACSEQEPVWDPKPILCPHGQLDPAQLAVMKRISSQAWQLMQPQEPLQPALQPHDLCTQCLKQQLLGQANMANSLNTRTELEELHTQEQLPSVVLGTEGHATCHMPRHYVLVSKTWLAGWFRRQGGMRTDDSPTTAITCPHGRLKPRAAAVAIPGLHWQSLKASWQLALQQPPSKPSGGRNKRRPTAAPAAAGAASQPATAQQEPAKQEDSDGDCVMVDDTADDVAPAAAPVEAAAAVQTNADAPGGADEHTSAAAPAPIIPVVCTDFDAHDGEVCEMCEQQLYAAMAQSSNLKRGIEEERARLLGLAVRQTTLDLQEGVPYRLIPRSWLNHWRAYVNQAPARRSAIPAAASKGQGQAGAATEAITRPPCLRPAMLEMLCPCHPMQPHLRVHPPPLYIDKRGKISAQDVSRGDAPPDGMDIVIPDEWDKLWSLYGPHAVQEPVNQQANGHTLPKEKADVVSPEVESALAQGFIARVQMQPVSSTGAAAAAAVFSYAQGDELIGALQQLASSPAGRMSKDGAGQPNTSQQALQEAVPVIDCTSPGKALVAQQQPLSPAGLQAQCTSPAPSPKQADLAVPVAGMSASTLALPTAGDQGHVLSPGRSSPRLQRTAVAQASPTAADAQAALLTAGPSSPQAAITAADGDGTGVGAGRAGGGRGVLIAAGAMDSSQPLENGTGIGRRRVRAPGGPFEWWKGTGTAQPAVPSHNPVMVTQPPICQEYIQKVREETKRAQLVYENAEIQIELITQDQLQEQLQQQLVAAAAADGGAAVASEAAGRSRRARRGRGSVTASSTTTLHELKLLIFQLLNIHPKNLQVYANGCKLESDELNLAQLEVRPTDKLAVTSTGEWDNNDLASVFSGHAAHAAGSRRREVETGFKDTALLSGGAHDSHEPAQISPEDDMGVKAEADGEGAVPSVAGGPVPEQQEQEALLEQQAGAPAGDACIEDEAPKQEQQQAGMGAAHIQHGQQSNGNTVQAGPEVVQIPESQDCVMHEEVAVAQPAAQKGRKRARAVQAVRTAPVTSQKVEEVPLQEHVTLDDSDDCIEVEPVAGQAAGRNAATSARGRGSRGAAVRNAQGGDAGKATEQSPQVARRTRARPA